ncbi:MAG TPA: hypothetical protein VGB37_09955, partial [Candidatus Lokiarchaeia archaeon]
MLKEIIYQYFDDKRLAKEADNRHSDKINFAPSYFTTCKRQIYYKKKNIPQSNPIETHSYIKFAMGDSVREKLQDIIKELNLMLECEDFKEIEWNDLNWIYRIDGKIKVNNEPYIIEIKSVYSSGYNSIEKEAKPEHEIQLLLYMIFEKIDRGILLYIGRDNGFIVEYDYYIDQLKEKYSALFIMKIQELKELKEKLENNILPDRDFQIALKN